MLSGYFETVAESVAGNSGAISAITSSLRNVGNVGNAGSRLPLIDLPVQSITAVTDALSGFRGNLYNGLWGLNPNDSSATVQNAVFVALGPGGANVLGDKNGIGGVTAADVFVTNLSAGGVDISIDIVRRTSFNTAFGLGIDSVPFKTSGPADAPVTVDLNYRNFNFGFRNSAAYFATTATDELKFQINGRLPTDSIYVGLGFLRFEANDATPGNNDLSIEFTADIGSGYGLTNARLAGSANLNIGLSADIPSSGLPRFKTNLKLDWAFPSGSPSLQLDDVRMNVGSMLGSVLNPIAEQIQAVTDPIQPVLDILAKRIPGVSDLYETLGGDPVTMLTMVKAYAALNNLPSYVIDALEVAVRLRQFADSVAVISGSGPNDYLSLGSFNITGPGGSSLLSAPAAALGDANNTNWSSLESSVGNVGFEGVKQQILSLLGDDVGSDVNSLFDRHNSGPDGNGVTFSVPLVEDPGGVAMGMLLGKNVDLVSMTANLVIGFDDEISFRPFPLVKLGLRAAANIQAFARLGFDTQGLRDAIAPMYTGGQFNFSGIRNGLWIDSTTGLSLNGNVEVFADAGIPDLAYVEVKGGVEAHAFLRLSNPNERQKIRPFAGDLGDSLFAVGGTVDASASLGVHIGVTVFGVFIGYEDSWPFASANLLKFTTDKTPIPRVLQPVELPPVHLGSYDAATKTLTLAMGPNAGLRGDPDLIAVTDEKFSVRRVSRTHQVNGFLVTQYDDTLIVSAFGLTEVFNDVDHVIGVGGSGNDSIYVDDPGFRTGATDYVLYGDEGADRIVIVGAVDATLSGGAGNDYLDGGNGRNYLDIRGGPGINEIVIGDGKLSNISASLDHITILPGDLSTLVLDDSDSRLNTTYSFLDDPNSNQWQLNIAPVGGDNKFIHYTTGLRVRILAGKGNDTFLGYPSQFATLNGGGGDDTLTVDAFSSQGLPSINYTFDFVGGAGHDTAIVSQANAPGGAGSLKLAYNTVRWGAQSASGVSVMGVEDTRVTAASSSTVIIDAWNNTPVVVDAAAVQVNVDMFAGEDSTVTLQNTTNLFLVDTVALPRVAPMGIDSLGAFAGAPGQRKLSFVSNQPINSIGLFGSDIRIDPSAVLFNQLSAVQIGGTVGEYSVVTITPPNPDDPEFVTPGVNYRFGRDSITIGDRTIPAFGFRAFVLNAGQGNDVIHVDGITDNSTQLLLHGGYGDDTLFVGDDSIAFSTGLRGQVAWWGDAGTDVMQVNDRGAEGSQSYTISGPYVISSSGATAIMADTSTEAFAFSGAYYFPSTYNIVKSEFLPWTIRGGIVNDRFSLSGLDEHLTELTLDPGEGIDTLAIVNDSGTTFPVVIYDDRVRLNETNIYYAGFDRLNYVGGIGPYGAPHNDLYVRSTSVGVPLNIFGGEGAVDTVYLGSDDGTTGTLSDLRGLITINLTTHPAGTRDAVRFIDTDETTAHSYLLSRYALIRDGVFLAEMLNQESVSITSGTGNDRFGIDAVDAVEAITVTAGTGDDILNLHYGDHASSSSAIVFDGQLGSDTINLKNSASTTGFTYRRNIGTMSVSGNAFTASLSETGVERVLFDAGTGADVFRITGVAAGTSLDISAGAGIDALLLGDLSFNVSNIFGPISFDTGTDSGRVQVVDLNSIAGKVAHLNLNSLGADPGDTLFGPGGSLQFTTLVNQIAGFNFDAMSILLGSGADTIYARPFATGTVGIEGRDPIAFPGDTLHLDLADAVNYHINPTNLRDGNVTSSNLRTLTYYGFETLAVVNHAPAVLLTNTTPTLPENTNTTTRIKVADVVVTDDGLGINVLSLTGSDAGLFELDGAALYLKAGTGLDFETKSSYDVTVSVDDSTIGGTPDSSVDFSLEILDRSVHWIGGSGDWNIVTNWRDDMLVNRLPGSLDDAVIDVAAAITVTHSTGTHTVQSLTINEPFTLSGGTLIVTGNLVQQNGVTFTITGGSLRNAAVVGEGSAVLVASGGTLVGVTLGGMIGGVPKSATLQSSNNFVLSGGLTLANGSRLDLNHQMSFVGDQTIDGDGEIRFGGAAGVYNLYSQITFGAGLTIHRSDANSTDIFSYGGGITNFGTIRADEGGRIRLTGHPGTTFTNAVGGVLAVDGGTLSLLTDWSNGGLMTVNNSTFNPNSTLDLGGKFTTGGLGAYMRTGGAINLTGLLDNTDDTLALDAVTGSWNLGTNGRLRGGSLVTSGGAVLNVLAGTLDGVTLGTTVSGTPLPATVQGTSGVFFVTGGLTLTNGSLLDLGNFMNLDGNQTLGGDGEIRFRGPNSGITNYFQTTFSSGLTIHRADAFRGVINLVGGSITNHGTIRADAGGEILVAGNPGTTFTNATTGVLTAAGGTLIVNTTTNYAAGTLTGGTWEAIGNGILRITGASIANNAATILLDGAGARITRDNLGTSALTLLTTNAAAGSLTLVNAANLSTAGAIINDGSLTIGPASTLTINGTFTQGSDASLAVEIGGAPTSGLYGKLVSSSAVALNGTLDVRLTNGYDPDQRSSFPILTFSSRTSDFTMINGLYVAGTEVFRAVYDATHLTLSSETNKAPTEVILDHTLVAENMPFGTLVGSLSTIDPNTLDTFTYALVPGTGSIDNTSFTIVGATLQTNSSFDFEVKSSYSVRIRSTDQDGLSTEKAFTISVNNKTELGGINVQNGQTQRSYLRTLDAIFDQSDGLMDLINNNRLQLTRFDLNGQYGLLMTMPARTAVANRIVFNFGIQGIGGNRNTNAGDGYYELGIDLDGNGSFESKKYFHRLLGDVNGDGIVSSTDKSQVLSASGSASPESDVNGDGLVNILDTSLVSRAVGRKLKGGLFRDD